MYTLSCLFHSLTIDSKLYLDYRISIQIHVLTYIELIRTNIFNDHQLGSRYYWSPELMQIFCLPDIPVQLKFRLRFE